MKSLYEELNALPDDMGIEKLIELLQSVTDIKDILKMKHFAMSAVEQLIIRFIQDKMHLCKLFTDKCDVRIKELSEISSILNEADGFE